MPKFCYPLPEGRGDCIIKELTLPQKQGFGVAALNLAKGNTTKAAVIEERLSLQSCLVEFGEHKFANAIEVEAAWENGTLTIRDKQFIQAAYSNEHDVTVADAVAFLASKEPDPDTPGQFRFLFPDWEKDIQTPTPTSAATTLTEEQIEEAEAKALAKARSEARDKNWLVMRILGVREAEAVADKSTGKGNAFSAVMDEERRLVEAATVWVKGRPVPQEDWKFVKVRTRKLIRIAYAKLHIVTEAEEASFFAGRREIP